MSDDKDRVIPMRADREKELQKILSTVGYVRKDGHKSLRKLFDEMMGDIDHLQEAMGNAEDKITELEDASGTDNVEAAFRDLIDSIERPVGTYNFNLSNKPRFDRAMLALCDAVNDKLASLP